MKKRIKALVSMGLAMAMLAACSNQEVVSSEQKESETTENSVVEASTEEKIEEPMYPEYLNLESARPIVNEGEEITLKVAIQRASVAETPVEDLWFFRFVEEKLNINLEVEWLTTENYEERKSLMLASNDLPDLMIGLSLKKDEVLKYGVENEMLLPLSDYVSEELTPNMLAIWEKFADYMPAYTAPNGKVYTIPAMASKIGLHGKSNTVPVYRGYFHPKYVEAAGIQELPDTLDEFVDYLRAVKALDPAEMGVDEIWPMVPSPFSYDHAYFTNAFGWMTENFKDFTVPCWDVEKGELVVPFLEDKFTDYITFYNMLYTEGLMHPDYYTMDNATIRAYESNTAIAFDILPVLYGVQDFENYHYLLPLSSEWNTEGNVTAGLVTGEGGIYVSSATEYPEVCMRFLDYLCSDEGLVYYAYGPAAGSEDTLGMITGYQVKEDLSGFYYEEVQSGKYSDEFTYTSNVINLTHAQVLPQDAATTYRYEMAGIEASKVPEHKLNLANAGGFAENEWANAAKGKLVDQLPTAFISTDVLERYTDLKTVLNNYINSEMAKFVVGQRALSELPDFMKELKVMGGEEYRDIILGAYANYEKPGTR